MLYKKNELDKYVDVCGCASFIFCDVLKKNINEKRFKPVQIMKKK